MICQGSGDGRSTLHPTIAKSANGQLEAQAMMRVTEVVKTADDIHSRFKGWSFAQQRPGAAGQAVEALAESSVEAFDKSGVDHTLALGFSDQGLDHGFSALNNAPGDIQLSIQALLDDLNDGDIWPGSQFGRPFSLPQFGTAVRNELPKAVT